MSGELVIKETGEIRERGSYGPEQIELLKNTIGKQANMTDDELRLFLHVCQRSGLDPFAKQIYPIRRKQGDSFVVTHQVAIDGYRAVAERSGNYAPGKEASFVYDKENKLVSATAYINKKVGDRWFEVASTAHLEEYIPKTWDSKAAVWKISNALWEKMPHVMLAKCAESAVLRKAFPNELSGTYTNEEMEQAPSMKPAVSMPKAIEPKA